MRAEDILRVESELNISLPDDYKRCLINYPVELKSDDISGPEYYDLINHPEKLIEENKEVAKDYKEKGEYTDFIWLENYFLIGIDGCGNFHYIDLEAKSSPVYYFDHETGEADEFSPSIDDYIKFCIELSEEIGWDAN